MPTNDLTLDKLMEVMRQFPPPQPSPLDLFRPKRLMGMDVYQRPDPPPKIQVRDIKLSDGTSLLSPQFRAKENLWWLAQFGLQPDPLGDKMFMLGNYGLVVKPSHMAMLYNLGA